MDSLKAFFLREAFKETKKRIDRLAKMEPPHRLEGLAWALDLPLEEE